MRASIVLLFLLPPVAVAAAPAPPARTLALVDISPRLEGEWADSDADLLARLRRRLEKVQLWRLAPADTLQKLVRQSPPAGWQARRDQGLRLLEQGEQHYRRLRPQQAIEALRAALASLQAVTPWLPDLGAIEQAHLLLGATWQALGRNDLADQAYRTVLSLNPELTPDETRFNPLVVQRLERLRRRLQTEARGSISFVSRPAGARVVVDGRPAGVSPVTVTGLAPGSHYAWLEAPGHRAWLGMVDVAPGRDTRQEVFLQPGESLRWVRLLERLRQTGPAAVPPADGARLGQALGCTLVLLVAIEHLGPRTVFQAALADSASGRVTALGIFPAGETGGESLVTRLSAWMRGESLPQATLTPTGPGGGQQGPGSGQPPPPPAVSWWRSWWFWTIVGVVAAGAAAGTTAAVLGRQSGYRLEVLR